MILSDALCLLGFNNGLSFLWTLEMSYCIALKLYYIPYTVLYSMDILRIDNNHVYLYTQTVYILFICSYSFQIMFFSCCVHSTLKSSQHRLVCCENSSRGNSGIAHNTSYVQA